MIAVHGRPVRTVGFRPMHAPCAAICGHRKGFAMGFSTALWALACLCCMFPVLDGIAIWYFSRSARLLQLMYGRHE